MTMPPIERKLAAIMSADVAGYSRLMGADEAGTLTTLSAHREVIDELIRQRNGRIANTAGDSVLAEFPSLVEAVQCSVEIQQAMAVRNAGLSAERAMLLRIGINVGDVMVKEEDIFGDGVNVAARLQGQAEPGGICISRAVRDQLRDKSPFIFEDMGEQAVKNIARPVRMFAVRFADAPAAGSNDVTHPAAEPPQAPALDVALEEDIEVTFWNSIKDGQVAAEYSTYLERYPDGHFSALALARLNALAAGTAAGNADDVKLEIVYWESVKDSDDVAMLRSYLGRYPDGHFRELAEARLAQLEA